MARLALLLVAALVLVAAAEANKRPFYKQTRAASAAGDVPAPKEAQSLNCCTDDNSNGRCNRYTDYAAYLSGYNNDFESGCFQGIWMLYDEEDYNYFDFNAPAYYAWGVNDCFNFGDFGNQASSLRFSGAPDGFEYDTINFYEGHYFMGDEQFFYQDATQFNRDNFGDSIIVSGCSPWTAYQYNNYEGSSICLYPSDTNNCYPGFFDNPDELGGLSRQFSSVRRGCYSDKKVYGKAVPEGQIQKVPRQGVFMGEKKN